jgi:hypothetical protein
MTTPVGITLLFAREIEEGAPAVLVFQTRSKRFRAEKIAVEGNSDLFYFDVRWFAGASAMAFGASWWGFSVF